MSDWGWVTTEGTCGEVPVKIQPDKRAEFVLDFVEDVVVESYDLPDGMKLIPGDVCILTVEITKVRRDQKTTHIKTKIFDIEFVQKSDQRPDSEVKDMMKHLEEAKERSTSKNRCHYCSRVDGSTPLTIKRDLHACGKCGRILTTEEYSKTQRY